MANSTIQNYTNALLDEDNMASNSSTQGATQQSIKAYVDVEAGGVAKAWINYNTVTTTSITSSYNITSVTDNGTGDTTITFDTDFSSSDYCFSASGSANENSANKFTDFIKSVSRATGTHRLIQHNGSTNQDWTQVNIIWWGDQ